MTELKVLDAEPIGQDVIAKLEEVLDRAREGKVSSVAVAVVYRDGTCGRCWSAAPSLSCLTGSVTRLLHAIIRFAEE